MRHYVSVCEQYNFKVTHSGLNTKTFTCYWKPKHIPPDIKKESSTLAEVKQRCIDVVALAGTSRVSNKVIL